MDLMKTLDLRKNIVLDLKKNKGIEGIKAQVVLALDYSGSMRTLYTNGKVQDLVERLLPLGLAFDDNGEVDFYLFHDGCIKLKESITRNNFSNYINSKIIGKYDMGGTNYSHVINQIVEDFSTSTTTSSGGFLGIGGTKKKIYNPLQMPVYVIFITDGETGYRDDVELSVKEAAKAGIFIQFVGIGGETFDFLQRLDSMSGRVIDNANFFKVKDLSATTDEALYNLLLTEFPNFIPQAKSLRLIL